MQQPAVIEYGDVLEQLRQIIDLMRGHKDGSGLWERRQKVSKGRALGGVEPNRGFVEEEHLCVVCKHLR